MNILCSCEGSPTVIFEGSISLEWTPIHSEVAKYTRACIYDRAGYGWSDPGPDPRTSAAMAGDLHSLLGRASVPAPYVLVGASFGGFPVRVFAGKYPTEVVGAVLVDASHEDQHEPASMLSPMNRLPAAIQTVMYAALPIMRNIGLLRFFSGSPPRRSPRPGMTREQEEYFQFFDSRPNAIVTDAKEAWNWEKSASEARLAGNLGGRPLIVLTAGRAFVPRNPIDAREAEDFHQNWVSNLQPQLARLSSRGRQVIVEKSGHAIASEAPEAVLAAIREVVMEVRAQRGNQRP